MTTSHNDEISNIFIYLLEETCDVACARLCGFVHLWPSSAYRIEKISPTTCLLDKVCSQFFMLTRRAVSQPTTDHEAGGCRKRIIGIEVNWKKRLHGWLVERSKTGKSTVGRVWQSAAVTSAALTATAHFSLRVFCDWHLIMEFICSRLLFVNWLVTLCDLSVLFNV